MGHHTKILVLPLLVLGASRVVALPEDAEQPIHILSDAAEVYEDSGLVIYRGSVRLDQGTLKVRADTMTIEIQHEKVIRITAEGNQATYEQQLRPDQSRVVAGAETIVYHTQDERIELIGGATLTQDDNEFKGDRIRYDLRAGKIDASAPQNGSVEMTFKPSRKPN
jgi:lipopolysaccharide export system protein LptA